MTGNRLGLSELYASMILLVIVSTMGTVIYSYTVEATQSYGQHFTLRELSESKRILERLTIVYTWWSGVGDDLQLTVYNYGEYDTSVVEVYVNGVRVEIFYTGVNERINTLDVEEISFQSPIPILDEEQYTIIIVSKRGVTDTIVWKA